MRIAHLAVFVSLSVTGAATLAAPPDVEQRQAAIDAINQKLSRLSDLTCDMIVGSKRSTLEIKLPARMRVTSVDEHGNEQLTIRNGRTQWRSLVPGSVSKTVFPRTMPPGNTPVPVLETQRYRLLGEGMQSRRNNVLARIEYRGVEETDGERCHVLATRSGLVVTWISTDDGLIRRQERRADDATLVTRFVNIQTNAGLSDEIFAYRPREGDMISEASFADGTWQRREYRIEFTPVTKDVQRVALPKLEEVQERFAATRGFKCVYDEDYKAHATYYVDDQGTQQPVGHAKRGTLIVEQPRSVRFEVEHTTTGIPLARRLLLITDGETVWKRQTEAGKEDDDPTFVLRDRLLPLGHFLQRKVAEAILRGDPVDGYDVAADIPIVALGPLQGIEPNRISFDGEQVTDGVRTFVFTVKPTDRDPASKHWIGVEDGVPRRIEIRNHLGNTIETTIRLSSLIANPELTDQTFAYRAQPGEQVINMADLRNTMQQVYGAGDQP